MKFEPGDIVEFYNQGTIGDDMLKKYNYKIGDLAKVVNCSDQLVTVKFLHHDKNKVIPIFFRKGYLRPVGFLNRLKALKEA